MHFLLVTLVIVFRCGIVLAAERAGENTVIFASYNLQNYLGEDQANPASRTKPKTDEEKAALVRVIRDISPDILGVCEMGSTTMLKDFRERLQQAGLNYPHTEWVDGPDRDRHLALLSRHPIVARNSQANVRFVINGAEQKCKRGFLDVTVQITPKYQLRCIGVHLKSKLPAPEGESLIRRHEATKLRKYLTDILANDPDTNLMCYGDFNDSRNTPTFTEITGIKGAPTYLADLWAEDEMGDRWTHYWRAADEYSRIDYLFVSRGLWREIKRHSSTVYRSSYWNEASDHRPIYTKLVPVDR